jgi:hypothetical protein
MSNDKKPDNVLGMPTNCCAEKCTKKSDRMNFCPEHYGWFKEGLLNKKGQKPSDFDKKFQAYLMKQKKAA